MAIQFTCPHCNQATLVGEEFVGQSGECRHCGRTVTVDAPIQKLPPIVILDDSRPRAARSSFGLVWKTAVVLLVLFAILIALMAPLINYARTEALRMSSDNNLKQMALSMHNYHDTYNHFPRPYWLTEKGERTMSWRVAIMPFLESGPVIEMPSESEAWDSPRNRELTSFSPSCYRGPWNPDRTSRETAYLVITGPGTMFEEGESYAFRDCTDGSFNTILIVEVKQSGIEWNEPRDLDIRTMIMQINASDSNGISAPWKNGAQVAMADGNVKFLPKDLLESTLRAMITRSGNESVQIPEAR